MRGLANQSMQARLDFKKVSPGAYEALQSVGKYLDSCGLEKSLMELVKIRASQINGCSNCLELHSKRARIRGETEQRVALVAAWREADIYTQRERAALEWTEALTRIDIGRVSDEIYNLVLKYFTEREVVDLSLVILSINDYNRLNIAFRTIVGSRQSVAAREQSQDQASGSK
jgi:AhpD family alkylhydroperoxidase